MIKNYSNKKVKFTFFFDNNGKSLKDILETCYREEIRNEQMLTRNANNVENDAILEDRCLKSIQSQRLIIEAFARHNNLKIVEEYVDDGYSDGNFDRPAFNRMIEDIGPGKINCVITKDLLRLGRGMYKTGNYIEVYFLEHNVMAISLDIYKSLSENYEKELEQLKNKKKK